MKKLWLTLILALLVVIGVACSNSEDSMKGHDMSNMKEEDRNNHDMSNMDNTNKGEQSKKEKFPSTRTTQVKTGKEFTLTAKEATHDFGNGTKLPVWTYDGSVPGSQIRVKQGDKVKINLKNELSEPVTIHWHGLPVPNSQDGIPGVTMNAVQPGKTFIYEFTASVPGTYWYHSHQDSVNQIDKGLYGTLIVEGKNEEKVDKDYTLVLDEWISSGESSMEGMDHGSMTSEENKNDTDNSTESMDGMNMNMDMEDDMSMYDLYTINGKSANNMETLKVTEGDTVKIRLVNAGYISHKIHLHGYEFKIVSTDGQPINNPAIIKDQTVTVAPGERYDLVFKANNPGTSYIESHDDTDATKNMVAKIVYDNSKKANDKLNPEESIPNVDITKYGKTTKSEFSLDSKYDVEYKMNLGTAMKDNSMVYTINNRTYPNTEPLNVKEGDVVKVTLKNTSKSADHPMHLHGHFFQVLSKNGKPIEGSPLMKDTLNVKPGEEYVVAFKADSPGNWMFHCHDLHHASAGMVTAVKYKGYKPSFTPDSNANNKPE
ncbi:multicopper oxidase family protein [Priestia megaterium]|uniref:multicopper oxidase family protein n=1 Tax=Priestia megaterium TaxID=1404 RepID=UPI00207A251F|nr:multicopper oxidase family protein [Priestia megaterium]USL44384.1 multicopper oxidase family protein [Priestia megaterium]